MRTALLLSLLITMTGCALPPGATCAGSGECHTGLCLRSSPTRNEGICTDVVVCDFAQDGSRVCPDGGACVNANVVYPPCLLGPCPAVPITAVCE
jgi:hypothetical protein